MSERRYDREWLAEVVALDASPAERSRRLLENRVDLKEVVGECWDQVVAQVGGQSVSRRDFDSFCAEVERKINIADLRQATEGEREDLFELFDFNGDDGLQANETYRFVKVCMLKIMQGDSIVSNSQKVIRKTPEGPAPDGAGYTHVRFLAKGGQGEASLVKDSSGTELVLKTYAKSNANACDINELIAEADHMRLVGKHGNIAHCFEIFQDHQNFYMISDFNRGGDWTNLRATAEAAGASCDEAWFRGLFLQAFQGLLHMHHHAVMHCDIKEPNIMLKSLDYKNPKVVIIDLGLSQIFLSGESACSGTPGYIPPETWTHQRWFPKGDLFSMGVVCVQVLAKRTPSSKQEIGIFQEGAQNLNGVQRFTEEREPPYEEMSPQSPDMVTFLKCCLEKDRKKRCTALQAIEGSAFFAFGSTSVDSVSGPPPEPILTPQKSKSRELFNARDSERRGMTVGINYVGSACGLDGCVADSEQFEKLMFCSRERGGFGCDPARKELVKILRDDGSAPAPTYQNMLDGFNWLVEGVQSGDELFLHYSGHGSQQKSKNSSEADGLDETLVPCDARALGGAGTAPMITDDWLRDNLVMKVPRGVRLIAIFDCCHSGSALDLPYKMLIDDSHAIERDPRMKDESRSEGHVIMFSGCQDEQTSADVGGGFHSPPAGAMTNALMKSLRTPGVESYHDVLKAVRRNLVNDGFDQIPQLTMEHCIDLSRPFLPRQSGEHIIPPSFQRKRALLIHVSGQEKENPAVMMDPVRKFLTDILEFPDKPDVRSLAGGGATRDNIFSEVRRLTTEARSGDVLVFAYCGQARDGFSTVDGQPITNAELREALSKLPDGQPMPKGVRLLLLLDGPSGTAENLHMGLNYEAAITTADVNVISTFNRNISDSPWTIGDEVIAVTCREAAEKPGMLCKILGELSDKKDPDHPMRFWEMLDKMKQKGEMHRMSPVVFCSSRFIVLDRGVADWADRGTVTWYGGSKNRSMLSEGGSITAGWAELLSCPCARRQESRDVFHLEKSSTKRPRATTRVSMGGAVVGIVLSFVALWSVRSGQGQGVALPVFATSQVALLPLLLDELR